ncbi:MAG TPA: copper oxidase [Rhodospirillaceae bacterium]|nr:copper oxidase [Rhodospirillaceae bacterium]
MDRRTAIFSGGAALSAAAAGLGVPAVGDVKTPSPEVLSLKPQNARYRLTETITEKMVSLSPDAPPPVIRMKQGVPFAADLTNGLSDYTTMHWHGIRVPNKMDGVPYLTQFPLVEHETYRYSFMPKDAGTYWYHPHCMTMEQMARGMTGIIIVAEKKDPGFDADIPINLRDFNLRPDGQFSPQLFSAKGAARAGTLGTLITANWQREYATDAPAGGMVRLRLAATDPTRIYKIVLSGADGKIIALDGHPLGAPWPLPTRSNPLLLSPGQRADFALKMPETEGYEVLVATMLGEERHVVSRLRSVGTTLHRALPDLRPLGPNPLSKPNLKKAEVHELVLGWSPEGNGPNNGFCGSMGATFWSINRKPWPGDAVKNTGPILTMKMGKSYILRLRNESPTHHPIHLHGLTFRTLRSNKRKIVPTWTDTVLVGKNETVDIAVVADNPGNWALHCHVIEHQKSGLSGFVRVV